MKKVALVTCRVLPEPDPDQGPLLAALRAAGIDADLLAWDDRSRDPGGFDLLVIRSAWDYHLHTGSFLKWIDTAAAATRVVNPAATVRWNHNKQYLSELRSAGVPIIPTVWFNRGEEADLGAVMESRRWTDVVIKPSVSASSYRTRRFTEREIGEGRACLRDLLRDRDAMVQKYISSVEKEGEKAIVWIDGGFTHSVRKSPRFAGGEEKVSAALPIGADELAVAEKAIARARGKILYGRVDVVRGDDGRVMVSELELIEPSLFLVQHPPALGKLVAGIVRLLSQPPETAEERTAAKGEAAPMARPAQEGPRVAGGSPGRPVPGSDGKSPAREAGSSPPGPRGRPEREVGAGGTGRPHGKFPRQGRGRKFAGARDGRRPGGRGEPFSGKRPSSAGMWTPRGEGRTAGGKGQPTGGERRPAGGGKRPFGGGRSPSGGKGHPGGKGRFVRGGPPSSAKRRPGGRNRPPGGRNRPSGGRNRPSGDKRARGGRGPSR